MSTDSHKVNFSPSAERNKEPIYEVLKLHLNEGRLLEIGSGTGQHAVYFSNLLPDIQWVTSDITENHTGIKERMQEAQLKNLHGPEVLKIGTDDFPKGSFRYVFSANTLHIMGWKEVQSLINLLGKHLKENSLIFIYGPFNYNNKFTSESNEKFDLWLKERNSSSGIRNFEDVLSCMNGNGMNLVKDQEMPSNNRLLIFKKL